jgi:mono/diheme cytochrome c family protein
MDSSDMKPYLIDSDAREGIRAFVAALLLGLAAAGAHAGHQQPPAVECPQPRFTGKAPDELYSRANPLDASSGNRRAGKKLYEKLSDPSCTVCHGKKGDGKGQLASQFDPPPRNFACAATIDGIPDGQLHWIIKHGSPGTAMPPFDYLSDEEIWQLVLYLRSLSGH